MTMKAAVIGAGHIGQQHLLALGKLRDVSVAVCDRSPALAEIAHERFATAHWFTDAELMFAEFKPEVVHICTPAGSHVPLGKMAIERGAHVFIEKPIAETLSDWHDLRDTAARHERRVIEDHNYLFNPPVLKVIEQIDSGAFGQVVHVEVMFALPIHGPDGPFGDPNLSNPILAKPGGAISDFLTHLSYLAVRFVGPHRAVRTIWNKRDSDTVLPHDEMRAMVDCEHGTAQLIFSSHVQPDVFRLVVHGTKRTAHINLFENTCHIDRLHGGPGALTALLNGLAAGRDAIGGAMDSLSSKLADAAGSYAGLHELVARYYEAIREHQPSPVSIEQIEATNELVHALTQAENEL